MHASQLPVCCSYSEETLLDELDAYPADAKLTLCTNFGSAISILAIMTCWLCGEDPLGEQGMGSSLGQVQPGDQSCGETMCWWASTPRSWKRFPVHLESTVL
jgi:hypothetical protein